MFLFYLIFGISFLVVGSNDIFDWKSCVLSLLIVLFLGLIVKFSNSYLFVQSVVMAIFFSLFIIPRLLTYLLIPGTINFSFGITVTSGQVNKAIFYMFIGAIFIYAGFLFAERVFKRFMANARPFTSSAQYHNSVIISVFLITIIVGWYIRHILGVSVYINKYSGAHNWLIQSLVTIFNIDTVFFMIWGALLTRNIFDKKTFFIGFFITIVFVAIASLNGSRGGAIRADMMIFIILLCIKGNFRVVFRYAAIFLVVLLLGYMIWPFCMQKRIEVASIDRKIEAYKKIYGITKEGAAAERRRSYRTVKPNLRGLLLYKNPQKHLSEVMNRMGVCDNEIIILSIDAEPKAKAKYMNMSYAAKNIANLILPGVVFKDAEINTSRVLPILYRAFNDEYLETGGYASDFYTPWGIFFLIFGWWKGWLMLFAAAAGAHGAYLLTMRFSGRFRYYMGALCVFSVSYMFFCNMGIDHWISCSVLILVSGAISLILLESGEFIFNKIKPLINQKSLY